MRCADSSSRFSPSPVNQGRTSPPLSPAGLPIQIPSLDRFPLVVEFLAFRKPEFHLDPPFPEIEPEGNQRETRQTPLAFQSANLLAVQQELPVPEGVMVAQVPVGVRGDVAVKEPDLSLAGESVAVLEVGAPLTKRLDLRSLENDTGLQSFLDEIMMKRLPVGREHLDFLRLGHRDSSGSLPLPGFSRLASPGLA